MKKVAVFPGSFDPITLGHVSVIKRAIPLFDQVIIAIGDNADKKHMFSAKQRENWIKEVFKNEPKVTLEVYSGLTVEFCKQRNVHFILRGLRTSADFEFERSIAQINRRLAPEVDTLFILTEAKYTPISSSIVRDVIRNGGNISEFVPPEVKVIDQ
ncbi:MAG: pantetheine-phosphate adenylyltransferase [Marinilabiliales bacterium]|jgi:pantetheine-phosphate adenylyltransferase|nr:MAG: pantetheine-phosphate adenylyltransferase [Marinilabiliales bacterium]